MIALVIVTISLWDHWITNDQKDKRMTLKTNDPKPAIQSKTMIANTGAVGITWLLSELFGVVVPAEVAVTILGVVNVVIRLITDKPIEGLWK